MAELPSASSAPMRCLRPGVRSVEDFRVAFELGDADAGRDRRPHHVVECCCRYRIVALMRHQASPQHVDRARRCRQQLLAERDQHRGCKFEPAGQRRVIDVERLDRRLAEMHHQIGTAFQLMHRLERNIVDQASVDEHGALLGVERRQQSGNGARSAHRLPDQARLNELEAMLREVGGDRGKGPPAILDPALLAILRGERAVERLVIEQGVARPGWPAKAAALDEDLVGAAFEMVRLEVLGKAGRHRRADAGADKDVEGHAAFAKCLVDAGMGGAETAAAGRDEADRSPREETNQAVDIDLVLQRHMVMHEAGQARKPCRGAAETSPLR